MHSNIEAINFSELYKEQREASTYKVKNRDSWDKKAKEMNAKIHGGVYNDTIMEKIDLDGVENILDVGCGPGTFALRFAPLVKKVYAFDFSQNMLDILNQNAKEQNLTNIETMQEDIESLWEDIPKCDVVLASRCLDVNDLEDTLKKLDAHAKKAVYLTFKVGKSYLSQDILKAMKREINPKPDYIYLVNVLYQLGINAKVDFIIPKGGCCEKILSVEDYIEAISWSLDGISKDEEKLIRVFYENCKAKNTVPPLRDNRWALISWTK